MPSSRVSDTAVPASAVYQTKIPAEGGADLAPTRLATQIRDTRVAPRLRLQILSLFHPNHYRKPLFY